MAIYNIRDNNNEDDRAHRICDPSAKPTELHHLENVFEANGFPPDLVKKTLQVPPKSAPPPTNERPLNREATEDLRIPYVHGLEWSGVV